MAILLLLQLVILRKTTSIVPFSMLGIAQTSLDVGSRPSSASNPLIRTRVNSEDRDGPCNNAMSNWMLGFEITPSGDIAAATVGNLEENDLNRTIFDVGNSTDFFRCWLTSINANNADPLNLLLFCLEPTHQNKSKFRG